MATSVLSIPFNLRKICVGLEIELMASVLVASLVDRGEKRRARPFWFGFVPQDCQASIWSSIFISGIVMIIQHVYNEYSLGLSVLRSYTKYIMPSPNLTPYVGNS